jgi:hypothetical protein
MTRIERLSPYAVGSLRKAPVSQFPVKLVEYATPVTPKSALNNGWLGLEALRSVHSQRPACSPSHRSDLYTRGSEGFVCSTAASVAFGGSDSSSREHFHPRNRPAPFHGAREIAI